jgi:hypothetical protein
MWLVTPIEILLCSLLLILWIAGITSCEKLPPREICIKGTIIGQGCLTNSYAIRLEGKNSDYGIAENIAYDNVVETLNLPEEFRINGMVVYFTFTKSAEETGKYLTYCSSAPQIVLKNVATSACPPSMHASYKAEAGNSR